MFDNELWSLIERHIDRDEDDEGADDRDYVIDRLHAAIARLESE